MDEMFYLIQKRRFPQAPLTVLLAALVVFVGMRADAADPSVDAALVKHFESKVRPLLLAKCVECHGAENQEAELRVDTAAGIFRGGKTGPIVVPGKPAESLLLIAVRRLGELKIHFQQWKFQSWKSGLLLGPFGRDTTRFLQERVQPQRRSLPNNRSRTGHFKLWWIRPYRVFQTALGVPRQLIRLSYPGLPEKGFDRRYQRLGAH